VIELSDWLITSIPVSDERAIDHFFGMVNERAIDLFLVIKGQVWPYFSAKYNIFIVSKLDEWISEWNMNNLLCKMYTVPYKLTDYSKMPDITIPNLNQRWFTSYYTYPTYPMIYKYSQ
jgi:hypothetical protein